MAYISTKLRTSLHISHIITIHYFEYMKDFYFPGESHDFWELLCVDKGKVEVLADERTYHLAQGDLILHKPMEFHSIRAQGSTAPNLIAISFKTSSPLMARLAEQCFTLSTYDKILISKIITEAGTAFSTPLNVPSIEQVTRAQSPPIGAEQLIQNYLEELLIGFIRRLDHPLTNIPLTPSIPQQATFENILSYLNYNLAHRLTVPQICTDNLISKSCLQALFHQKVQMGVIAYFHHLKIAHAKQLLRTSNLNYTQIADALSYSSAAHFSKQFKHVTGMTPTEYNASIKHLSDTVSQATSRH